VIVLLVYKVVKLLSFGYHIRNVSKALHCSLYQINDMDLILVLLKLVKLLLGYFCKLLKTTSATQLNFIGNGLRVVVFG
jgi:hypothetical protein